LIVIENAQTSCPRLTADVSHALDELVLTIC
jgi:hypothetical protein